ncbi:MAG: GNAT family N-acetyltransferase [Schleiferiaceae bacterium]|nr:GNAT family N-acetyltransferase [Schleiferiaceae bacterium]
MNIYYQAREGHRGRFVGPDAADVRAYLEVHYTEAGEMVIDSTQVDPALRGQGVAAQLLEAAVSKARQESRKVMPVCSYAVKKMEGREAYADVLASH